MLLINIGSQFILPPCVVINIQYFGRRLMGSMQISKSKIIFISFSTLQQKLYSPSDIFISAFGKPLGALRADIISHLPPPSTNSTSSIYTLFCLKPIYTNRLEILIIIDKLNSLAAKHQQHLSTFLSSLLLGPHISLLATYHLDVPLPHASKGSSYQPGPLTILTYLATAVLRVDRLSSVILRKKARDRSLVEPVFGLEEGREGILVSPRGKDGRGEDNGVVVEMEIRRKSGRGVREIFVLQLAELSAKPGSVATRSIITLLDDHPSYSPPEDTTLAAGGQEEDIETTFNLGLTEKQRKDREGVVLPYFDAQRDGGGQGPGEGGRILYEMGAEDREDFDDEEDEI
jgi:elongator complex protein 5